MGGVEAIIEAVRWGFGVYGFRVLFGVWGLVSAS